MGVGGSVAGAIPRLIGRCLYRRLWLLKRTFIAVGQLLGERVNAEEKEDEGAEDAELAVPHPIIDSVAVVYNRSGSAHALYSGANPTKPMVVSF
jgi:hypothetical protein